MAVFYQPWLCIFVFNLHFLVVLKPFPYSYKGLSTPSLPPNNLSPGETPFLTVYIFNLSLNQDDVAQLYFLELYLFACLFYTHEVSLNEICLKIKQFLHKCPSIPFPPTSASQTFQAAPPSEALKLEPSGRSLQGLAEPWASVHLLCHRVLETAHRYGSISRLTLGHHFSKMSASI